jgi:integrase
MGRRAFFRLVRKMPALVERMFFEVYSRWIDGEVSEREKAKLDALLTKP